MSLTNPKTVVTEERLSEFYQKLLPYLGGSADAGFTPVGSIIAMMSNSAPANYLACDGAIYNISNYPELADHFFNEFGSRNYFGGNGTTTFAVPDLRGEFIRGTGTNSHTDQGNGANVGVHQNATKHIDFRKGDDNKINMAGASGLTLESTNADKKTKTSSTTGWTSNASPVTWSGDGISWYTSRPTNTSVLYCIATKNIYLNPSLDYSTNEKVVGTWIDGKPIYQKTILFGNLPNNSAKKVPIGVNNIDKIVDFKAIAIAENNAVFILPSSTCTNLAYAIECVILLPSNEIQIITAVDRSTAIGYVTIQYTKTS